MGIFGLPALGLPCSYGFLLLSGLIGLSWRLLILWWILWPSLDILRACLIIEIWGGILVNLDPLTALGILISFWRRAKIDTQSRH